VAAGATCCLGELAATTHVIFFINFIWKWFFLTIHSAEVVFFCQQFQAAGCFISIHKIGVSQLDLDA
jgi:hypothetical protein